jgi:integrase
MNKARYIKVYNRNKRLDKNGKAPINIAVYFNRNVRRYVNTGISVVPAEWNERKRVVKKHKNAIRLNYEIDTLITKIEAYELGLLNREIEFTPTTLVSYLQKGSGREFSFIAFGWDFIEGMKIDNAPNTISVYSSFWKRLEKFSKDLKFKDVNRGFIENFDKYLKEQKYSVGSIHSIHRFMKSVVKEAMNTEPPLLDRTPYVNLRIITPTNTKHALSPKELEAFENVETYSINSGIIKDMFLVSAYTGARYSDVIRMSQDFFIDDETMLFEMKKTKHDVSIPIKHLFKGKALGILRKYKSHNPYFAIKPSLQTIETNLVKLAKLAKIKKHVTFHVARHTFGTTLADMSGDPFLVMSLMGHKDINATMKYFHDNPETRRKKILKLEWE